MADHNLQDKMSNLNISPGKATGQQPPKKAAPAVPPKPKKPMPQVPLMCQYSIASSSPSSTSSGLPRSSDLGLLRNSESSGLPRNGDTCLPRSSEMTRSSPSPIYSNVDSRSDIRNEPLPLTPISNIPRDLRRRDPLPTLQMSNPLPSSRKNEPVSLLPMLSPSRDSARNNPYLAMSGSHRDLRRNEPTPSLSMQGASCASSGSQSGVYSNVPAYRDVPTYYDQQPLYSNVDRQPTYTNLDPTLAYRDFDRATYSNADHRSTYSNMNTYANLIDDLPPPPPEPADYSDFPPPPTDLPPPPSPVSSSYSELRRATHSPSRYQPDYSSYSPPSQSSSTYESIYEPINPRPPSGMSSRSNYSLYAPYVKGAQAGPQSSRLPQEAEVDALTDLLVQSMDSSTTEDSELFGDCVKCGKKVIGEESGCTAMDQIYHISCFRCTVCGRELQGKPSYTVDKQPYCEEDYLETLEKCSVCLKPILDRIIRATGRPYHPQCFCCFVCQRSLDGIPFTVDAHNQTYCIEDFHKKFAPRCCVCNEPIMPVGDKEETVRVVALDRSFHVECYKCEDCKLKFTETDDGSCYPLDNHVYCKDCNAKRVRKMTTEL